MQIVKPEIMKYVYSLSLMLLVSFAHAQEKALLRGQITDSLTTETLIGATVLVPELGIGATSDINGSYTLHLPSGTYEIQISFIGYQTQTQEIQIYGNHQLDIHLSPTTTTLGLVTITGRTKSANVEGLKMSSEVLSINTIKEIPAFMGEVDVLKAIQALPGVQSAGEGTTGYFVRGGSADQNLVLLDGATVYNPSHLMGFFSVFNADAIQEAELFKGGVPAQ
jgi:hypothetical protein